jgi:hypothetical protein
MIRVDAHKEIISGPGHADCDTGGLDFFQMERTYPHPGCWGQACSDYGGFGNLANRDLSDKLEN